jgi:predicted membrane protein
MNTYHRSHDLGRLVFGLIVLALGVIFVLNNLGLAHLHHYLRYWPVLLMAYGLARLLQPRRGGGRVWGLLVGVFGALLLLRNLHQVDFSVWALWPLFLVLIGLNIIWHALAGRPRQRRLRDGPFPPGRCSPQETDESVLDESVVFGASEKTNISQDFRGGRISVMMGAYEIDLRRASIVAGPVELEVSASFSGVEIRVPEDWYVILKGSPVLGGVNNQTHKKEPGAKTLVVTARVFVGGVEVRN